MLKPFFLQHNGPVLLPVPVFETQVEASVFLLAVFLPSSFSFRANSMSHSQASRWQVPRLLAKNFVKKVKI